MMNDTESSTVPRQLPRMEPEAFTDHPVSVAEARAACYYYVGYGKPYWIGRFARCLDAWWDRLRASEVPEERLSCERMINAINQAIGLHRHELGEKLAERNRERRSREETEIARAEAQAAEATAIDRWRQVG